MNSPTLIELRNNYQKMTQEQFDSLEIQELTEIARIAYAEERERRNSPEWKAEQNERDIKQKEKDAQKILKDAKGTEDAGFLEEANKLYNKVIDNFSELSECKKALEGIQRIEKVKNLKKVNEHTENSIKSDYLNEPNEGLQESQKNRNQNKNKKTTVKEILFEGLSIAIMMIIGLLVLTVFAGWGLTIEKIFWLTVISLVTGGMYVFSKIIE